MPEDEKNPNGGEVQEPAAEPKESPSETVEAPHGDPLDEIQDPDALRAEAKKFRGIAQRGKPVAKVEKPAQQPPAQQPQTFATKESLAVIVTNQAKQLVSDEVREHWDELMKIDLQGYDSMDASSIAQNMSERLTILKERKPQTEAQHGLDVSPGVRGATGKPIEAKPKVIPRMRGIDEQAEQLYGPKK